MNKLKRKDFKYYLEYLGHGVRARMHAALAAAAATGVSQTAPGSSTFLTRVSAPPSPHTRAHARTHSHVLIFMLLIGDKSKSISKVQAIKRTITFNYK